jgi:hypothetical protein
MHQTCGAEAAHDLRAGTKTTKTTKITQKF